MSPPKKIKIKNMKYEIDVISDHNKAVSVSKKYVYDDFLFACACQTHMYRVSPG